MDEALEMLFRAQTSLLGILIRAGCDARTLYQRLHKAKQSDPTFAGLQLKAAASAFPEADFIIFKKHAQIVQRTPE